MSDDNSFCSVSDSESESAGECEVGPFDVSGDLDPKDETMNEDYQLLNPDKLTSYMNEIIQEVEQIMKVPTTTLRLLLTRFSWDKDRLLENCFDNDLEKIFQESSIVNPFAQSFSNKPSTSDFATKPKSAGPSSAMKDLPFCEICVCPKPLADMFGLGCGHTYCKECWVRYLTCKIIDENQGEHLMCPALGCRILVDDSTVFSLLIDQNVRKRFQKHITNSFVMCNRLLAWCPGVECTYAVRVPQNEVRRIVCHCGEEFCFACGQPWHDPVLCRLLKRWLKKIQDDSETSNWIAANTKECPKCHVTIEKDGGCNHMICKSNSCRYEFCWVCLGRWEPHGSAWYNCNRYDEREAQKARDAQEISRAALQRYLFYFNRYVSHSQSLKFENKLYESVKRKMEEMQSQGMSWIEVQFLKKAVDVLCMCRRTLMYTYVFAYYLKKNNQSIIFENNQSDLEMATEQLSEYLEREITTDILTDIKQKVQDKSRYCENRRLVLLKHVHEGYEHDMWEHLESS